MNHRLNRAVDPVVTSTPVPLLYHIRTFYMVRYSFLTTHKSQPAYTIEELQRKKIETKEDFKKKKTSQTHSQHKTKHNIHIIIQIFMISISTTNIQIPLFKTTFHILNTLPTYKYVTSKQYSCVQVSLRECFGQALAGFLITIHNLRAFLLYLKG